MGVHVDKEEMMLSGIESIKAAILLLGVGVMGHSWDTYSDIGLCIQLASGTYEPAFGESLLHTDFIQWLP